MVDIENMSFAYPGDDNNIFYNYNLHIDKGTFLVLSGKSGSGKTTLINLLFRELIPSEGTIRVFDTDISRLKGRDLVAYKHTLGVVFQDSKLISDQTVYENLEFTARILGLNKKAAANRIVSILSMLGIADLHMRMPTELSGGQKQKVCMARALIGNPRLLLCDEPTGNLDPDSSYEFMSLLNLIHLQGTTVVLATHDLKLVSQFKDTVITNLD